MWNTVLNINTILWAISFWFLIFSVGLSVYTESFRPLEFGIIAFAIVTAAEVIFSAFSE